MQRGILRCASAPFLLLLTLFAMTMPSAQADVVIERVTYRGWKNSYRMSNGTVDLVIVPEVARIMRYGYQLGPNMLWENPTAAGKPIPLGQWPNTGGDKVWPWKQDDWETITGQSWPPPAAADQAPYQAEIVGKDTVRLTSAIVVPYGIRIIRDIRLASQGTQVFFSNRFMKVRDGGNHPIGVWTVTQVPATPWVLARTLPTVSALTVGYISLAGEVENAGFAAITTMPEGALKVERRPDRSAKLGTEADLLATLQKDILFTVRIAPSVPTDNAGATFDKGERAQIYNQPDNAEDASRGITPYIELEFTSPRKELKKGETLTMEQIWELRRLPVDRLDVAHVAETLKTLR